MKKIYYFAAVFLMAVAAVLGLLILSLLTYYLQWQADTASIGITVIYVLAGFSGGCYLKWYPKWKEKKQESILSEASAFRSFGQSMREAFLAGSLFMLLLLLFSFFLLGNDFALSKKAWIIWLLLSGSTCIGRII